MAAIYGFTVAMYTAALKAFAAGVTSITVEGRTTSYIDREDMLKNINLMYAELVGLGLIPATNGVQPVRAYRMIYRKGL